MGSTAAWKMPNGATSNTSGWNPCSRSRLRRSVKLSTFPNGGRKCCRSRITRAAPPSTPYTSPGSRHRRLGAVASSHLGGVGLDLMPAILAPNDQRDLGSGSIAERHRRAGVGFHSASASRQTGYMQHGHRISESNVQSGQWRRTTSSGRTGRSRNLLAAVSSVLTSVKEWQFSTGLAACRDHSVSLVPPVIKKLGTKLGTKRVPRFAIMGVMRF
jgi:hypothetical protein